MELERIELDNIENSNYVINEHSELKISFSIAQKIPQAIVFHLNGLMHQGTGAFVLETVTQAIDRGYRSILLDFSVSEVSHYMDVADSMYSIYRNVRDAGGNLIISSIKPEALEAIRSLGYHFIFTITDTLEDALEEALNFLQASMDRFEIKQLSPPLLSDPILENLREFIEIYEQIKGVFTSIKKQFERSVFYFHQHVFVNDSISTFATGLSEMWSESVSYLKAISLWNEYLKINKGWYLHVDITLEEIKRDNLLVRVELSPPASSSTKNGQVKKSNESRQPTVNIYTGLRFWNKSGIPRSFVTDELEVICSPIKQVESGLIIELKGTVNNSNLHWLDRLFVSLTTHWNRFAVDLSDVNIYVEQQLFILTPIVRHRENRLVIFGITEKTRLTADSFGQHRFFKISDNMDSAIEVLKK